MSSPELHNNAPYRRVGIIGAGPGGLAAAKSMLEASLEPTVFEKNSTIGGLWNYDEDAPGGGGIAYRSLKTNTAKQLTAFSDFPFPPKASDFPSREEVLNYINKYADHFDLLRHIRLNTTVENAYPTKNGGWEIRVRTETDQEQIHNFDALIVANGYYQHPFIPPIKGLRTFTGELVHSIIYKGPEPFAGKRVVVIGTGSSGADIAGEVSEVAEMVEASTKSGVWFSPHFYEGKPTDLRLNRIGNYLPMRIKKTRFEQMLLHTYEQMGYSSEAIREKLRLPPFNISNTRITRGTRILGQILKDRVMIKPGIECIDGNLVKYVDGTFSEADIIIFCTGFSADLPFLSHSIISIAYHNQLKLYKHVFHPKFPNITFIGLSRVSGPVLPVMEMQARWIAQIYSARLQLPSSENMAEKIEDHFRKAKEKGMNPMQIRYAAFMEEIALIIDVRPRFLLHPRLIRKLLFGPLISAQYRLDGPGKSKNAANIISETGRQ